VTTLEAPVTMRTRARALAPLSVMFLAFGLSTALSFPFLSLFLTSAVHAGPGKLTVFLLVQPLAGVVVSTLIGRMSDGRVARRHLLMACSLAGVTSASLYSVVRSYWVLVLLACTITAVGGALMAQSFGYARAVLADDPSAPMITSTLRTFFSLAWVAGPPLASLLLGAGGFVTLYICAAALYGVVLAVAALWLAEPAAQAVRAPSDAASASGAGDVGPRALWLTLGALVLLQSAVSLNVQAVPLLVRHELHASVTASGVVLAVCAALEIPMMLGFGALSTRLSLGRLVAVGPVFGIAYYAVAAASGQVWQLGVAQVLNACFIAVIQGLAISYVQELLPSQPGRASTLYSNTFPCGAILAGPLLGLGAKLGYRVSFLAAVCLAGVGLALLLAGQLAHRQPVGIAATAAD
jgi:SET family sugar efflux transporter-like MFS transporter